MHLRTASYYPALLNSPGVGSSAFLNCLARPVLAGKPDGAAGLRIAALQHPLTRANTEIPRGTILDDVFVPMHLARTGKRVVFQPSAVAHDSPSAGVGRISWSRCARLTGSYQSLRVAPWLLYTANRLLFRFISHKVLRLALPLLFLLMLLASSLSRGPLYRECLLASNDVLRPDQRRSLEQFRKEGQTTGDCRHICDTQRSSRHRVLQFHCRAEQSMALER